MFELPSSNKLGRLARWALPGAVVLMGLALFATVWTTNRGVEDASETLIRGQSSVISSAIRSSLPRGETPTREMLDELRAQYAADGLRYIAVLDDRGLIADAGDPPADRDELFGAVAEMEPGVPERVGDRVRAYYGRPRRPNRDRDKPRTDRPSRPRAYVLEFEPRIADGLRADARRSLAIGGVAGVALLLLAIVAIRWHLRREALELALAQERRLASLGEMSAVLAHEIRNPIASLKGNAQLLARMLDEDKPRAKAERLVAESNRLQALTDDLLEFARAGAIERAAVAPATLLRDAAANVAGRDRIHIDDSGAPERWSLDTSRILQVLRNLLDNACDASAEHVDASCTRDCDELVFRVRDRGEGISPADAEHMFEPFFTKKTRGTGLGLAVSRRLVELHGGTITAENHPDGGAVFRVAIPNEAE